MGDHYQDIHINNIMKAKKISEILEGVADKIYQRIGIEDEFDKFERIYAAQRNEIIGYLSYIHGDKESKQLKKPAPIFKNPKKLGIYPNIRGVIDNEGDLYLCNTGYSIIHDDILYFLDELGVLKYDPTWARKDIEDIGYVTIQRYNVTNNFYIGESNVINLNDNKDVKKIKDIKILFNKCHEKNPQYNFILNKISYLEESLDFKREGDSKEKLNIGKYSSNLPKDILFKFIHEEAKKCEYFTKVSDIDYKNKEPMFKIETVYKAPNINLASSYEYKEYCLYLTENEGILCFDEWNNTEHEIKNLKEFKKHTNCKTLEIKESLEFERRGEPFKKINIGQEAIDKKIIEEIDWFKEFPENIQEMELIRDYKGFPILIIKHLVKSFLDEKSYPKYTGITTFIGTLPYVYKRDAINFMKESIDNYINDEDYYDPNKISIKKPAEENIKESKGLIYDEDYVDNLLIKRKLVDKSLLNISKK